VAVHLYQKKAKQVRRQMGASDRPRPSRPSLRLVPAHSRSSRADRLNSGKFETYGRNGVMSRDDPTVSLDPRYFPTGAVLERPVTQRPKHDSVDPSHHWPRRINVWRG
jgi:hypothetical protein